MHIGVLGTGIVGRTLAQALVDRGHEMRMGSRAAGNATAVEWAEQAGPLGSEGSFADAAAFGELAINATAGAASLEALEAPAPSSSRARSCSTSPTRWTRRRACRRR